MGGLLCSVIQDYGPDAGFHDDRVIHGAAGSPGM